MEYKSLESEMIALTLHDHPLFCNDNGAMFNKMEIGLRGTTFAASIVRYRNKQDGCKAMEALTAQHAGKPVWESRIKECQRTLQQHKWNGQSSVTLKLHFDKHRTALVALSEASDHATH